MHETIEGLDGTGVIADDFLITGKDDAEHDANLQASLNRCRERNLVLNAEKVRYKLHEVSFMGCLLTDGRHETWPEESRDYTRHANAHRRRRSASPHMYSTIPRQVCEGIDRPHSSIAGIDMQGQRVHVEWVAQIEKELLAMVFACEKFNDYIYERNAVHVETDHKSLESIFKKEIHMAPKRLQRMRMRLQKYPLEVRYKKGSQMYVADTVSWAYNTDTKRYIDSDVNTVDDSEERMFRDNMMLSEQKLIELQHATRNDAVLQELKKAIKTGWPAVEY